MRSLILVTSLAAACVALADGKKGVKAPAPGPVIGGPIQPKSGATLGGDFKVKTAADGKVTIEVTVSKAPAGDHAVHLHETGDCSSPDGKSAGPHWNPGKENHGEWGHAPHHLGDIGNMKVGADGNGTIVLTTDQWTFKTGKPNDVEGKALIIHEKIDDFKTQPAGNAGNRIGCAVLKTP